MEKLYEKNGNILYILNILKKYSDEQHPLKATHIQKKVEEIYKVQIDPRTIRRNIHLLKEKLGYDISTYEENKKGYYITKNPETDFEAGEIRAIIDTFSYSSYIVPSIAKSIIKKCKNMQNVYDNQKLRNYKIYSKDSRTTNMEVIKNIEDLTDAILSLSKVHFEYWKYEMKNDLKETIVSTPIVTPYAIVYNEQQFYLIGIKERMDKFYYYRLDRMRELKILKEKRTITKKNSEIQEFAEKTVEMFGGENDKIEAICGNCLINAVIDKFGKNVVVKPVDSEKFSLKLETDVDGFRFWALRNLKEVEVLKPAYLREEIGKIVEDASKKYVSTKDEK